MQLHVNFDKKLFFSHLFIFYYLYKDLRRIQMLAKRRHVKGEKLLQCLRVRRIFPPGLTFPLRIRARQVARKSLRVSATRTTGEAAARGGHSCIGEVTVSGNRVRAGASGTRRRSVTRPTDPLKRLELSPSRLLRARCSFLCHRRRRRRRRRPSSSVQEPARVSSRFACW